MHGNADCRSTSIPRATILRHCRCMVNYYKARTAFPGSPSGVRHARGWLAQRVAGHPRADDIDLCAAELATNAKVHSTTGRKPPGAQRWCCVSMS